MAVKVKVKGKVLYRRLGEKVYLARRRMGITQDKLAEDTGLDRSYISQIENGKRNLSVKSALELSRTLNISVGTLLGQRKLTKKSKFKTYLLKAKRGERA